MPAFRRIRNRKYADEMNFGFWISPFGEVNTPLGQADERILKGFKRMLAPMDASADGGRRVF
jgi:hypothetical protein